VFVVWVASLSENSHLWCWNYFW